MFAALLALLLALWAPAALAHHKDGHSQGGGKSSSGSDHDGDADSDSGTTYTEDNDPGESAKDDEDPNASQHPSGKDRYDDPDNAGNQGKSESDPDDDGRGPERCEPVSSRNSGDGTCGADKPGGTGGEDIYDQDGNNGCGNDQDFDDDNEGWCGKPTEQGPSAQGKPTEEIQGIVTEIEGEDVVKGVDLEENPAAPEADTVLGIRVSAAPAVAPVAVAPAAVAPAAVAAAPEVEGAVLPFTGASDLVAFVAVALMLIGIGALSVRGRRNTA